MIHKLLYGKTDRAKWCLYQLVKSLGKEPNMLWYPSAGDDYRDILEFSQQRAALYGMDAHPALHIHTDYMPSWLQTYKVLHKADFKPEIGQSNIDENIQIQRGIVYEDDRTIVRIKESNELFFRRSANIQYSVKPQYADFAEEAPTSPKAYLLDVEVGSVSLGIFRKPVLYFFFENINFLEEVLLKQRWRISHLLKVREGCGFGGNRKSISLSYALLSELQTRYLMVDTGVHIDMLLVDTIAKRFSLTPKAVGLERVGKISLWSNYSHVNIFRVEPEQRRLMQQDLNSLVRQVQQ